MGAAVVGGIVGVVDVVVVEPLLLPPNGLACWCMEVRLVRSAASRERMCGVGDFLSAERYGRYVTEANTKKKNASFTKHLYQARVDGIFHAITHFLWITRRSLGHNAAVWCCDAPLPRRFLPVDRPVLEPFESMSWRHTRPETQQESTFQRTQAK